MLFCDDRKNRLFTAAILLLSLCVCAFSLKYYIANQLYYINSDSLYYYGCAESLLTDGTLSFRATDVPEKPGTPQVGIILLMSVLLSLGITREALFVTIVFIALIAHLSCLYPLYRLSRMIGCKSLVQSALVLAAVLLNRQYLYTNVNVLNDGFFNVVSLWLMYSIASLMHAMQSPDVQGEPARKKTRLLLSLSIFCTILATLFRVQAVVIAGAALLASCIHAVFARRFRLLAMTAAIGAVSGLTLFVLYRLFPLDAFSPAASSAFGWIFDHAIQKILYCMEQYLVALVAIALLLKTIVKPEKTDSLFLVLVCCLGLLFTFSMKYNSPFDRYLSFIWPLTMLFIIRVPFTRYVGYALLFLFAVQSVAGNMRAPEYYHRERFFLYLDNHKISLPGPPSMTFTQPDYDRLAHYFLKTKVRFSFDPGRDSLSAGNEIVLAGSRDYVERQMRTIETMATEQQVCFSRTSLSQGYSDEAGNALIKISDIASCKKTK
jgi:hypothetical protein